MRTIQFLNSKILGEYDEERVKFLVAQDVYDEIEQGVALLEELLTAAENDQRISVRSLS